MDVGKRIEAVQKRIGSRAAKASFILGRVTRLEKGHRKNSGLNCICEELCDVESRGRGRREVESTNRDEPRRRQKRRPSLSSCVPKKAEGGGLWRLARAPRGREGGREGLLGPYESSQNEVCTAALSEVRNRTQSQKMRIDRRYLQGLRMWLMRVSM